MLHRKRRCPSQNSSKIHNSEAAGDDVAREMVAVAEKMEELQLLMALTVYNSVEFPVALLKNPLGMTVSTRLGEVEDVIDGDNLIGLLVAVSLF